MDYRVNITSSPLLFQSNEHSLCICMTKGNNEFQVPLYNKYIIWFSESCCKSRITMFVFIFAHTQAHTQILGVGWSWTNWRKTTSYWLPFKTINIERLCSYGWVVSFFQSFINFSFQEHFLEYMNNGCVPILRFDTAFIGGSTVLTPLLYWCWADGLINQTPFTLKHIPVVLKTSVIREKTITQNTTLFSKMKYETAECFNKIIKLLNF